MGPRGVPECLPDRIRAEEWLICGGWGRAWQVRLSMCPRKESRVPPNAHKCAEACIKLRRVAPESWVSPSHALKIIPFQRRHATITNLPVHTPTLRPLTMTHSDAILSSRPSQDQPSHVKQPIAVRGLHPRTTPNSGPLPHKCPHSLLQCRDHSARCPPH